MDEWETFLFPEEWDRATRLDKGGPMMAYVENLLCLNKIGHIASSIYTTSVIPCACISYEEANETK